MFRELIQKVVSYFLTILSQFLCKLSIILKQKQAGLCRCTQALVVSGIGCIVKPGKKILRLRPPPHYHITDISPPRTPLPAGNSSVCIINVAPAPPQPVLHCRHRCTTPPLFPLLHFFVTLQFSNLVPYVAILKMFHVKKFSNHYCITQNFLTFTFLWSFSKNSLIFSQIIKFHPTNRVIRSYEENWVWQLFVGFNKEPTILILIRHLLRGIRDKYQIIEWDIRNKYQIIGYKIHSHLWLSCESAFLLLQVPITNSIRKLRLW